MGRNTMTFFQKREIVSASMKVYSAVNEVNRALTGHNTRECDRIVKLLNMATWNVRYWIDRPVLQLTAEENEKTSKYLDGLWQELQKSERLKDLETNEELNAETK